MTTWETCRMGYASFCDVCRRPVDRGSKAYLIGASLNCPSCFDRTKEAKRRDKAMKRRPPSKTQVYDEKKKNRKP